MQLEIPDDWATEEEIARLQALFNTPNESDFQNALSQIAAAGVQEYKEMLLGQGLPTRADEIRQHRLFSLIKAHFSGRIPSETEVSRYFQLTQRQSRALIQNVRTRFKFQLEEELKATLRSVLESAAHDEDGHEFRVAIQSDNILDELKSILETEAPMSEAIQKIRGSARTYSISEDSYQVLVQHLGME